MDDIKFEDVVIKCPYCNKEYKQRLYGVVDCSNKKLVDRLLDGNFYQYSCPHCEQKFEIRHQVLFINDNNDTAVAFSENQLESMELESMIREGGGQAGSATDDIELFFEKAQISILNIDARVVEILKVVLLQEVIKDRNIRIEKVICHPSEEDLEFIYRVDCGDPIITKIPIEHYFELKKELRESLTRYEYKQIDEKNQIINLDWAIQFLQENY